MHAELLVTGCYRSGTTLLEKLLHAHPDVSVASQPFPALYSHVKALFDESRGLQQRYPLSHRFLEVDYTDEDFAAYLDRRPLTEADLDAVFGQLRQHAEGHWTPEILGARARIRPGVFLDVYRQLMEAIGQLLPKPGARVIGSKEILVEEYVPYLLNRGLCVVVILRDPRDIVASHNFSERDSATGLNRPVLYSMRIWRKSVATALEFEGHSRFHWLRYEDLVANPGPALSAVTGLLKLPQYPPGALAGPLRDQRGGDWEGNSSFHEQAGVSRESVGRFRTALPETVQAMIETVAGPEMAVLGYIESPREDFNLDRYRDPFDRIHAKFPSDYSADVRRVRDERERLALVKSSATLTDDEARRWFVYPRAYRRLQGAGRAR